MSKNIVGQRENRKREFERKSRFFNIHEEIGCSKKLIYKVSFNKVVGCLLGIMRYNENKKLSQSKFSEELGFNRKLLSKYELGDSNISFSTYIYLLNSFNVERDIFDILVNKILNRLLAEGIYTYLNLENVALTNHTDETLNKYYVKNSYKAVLDWFDIVFDIKHEQFSELEDVDLKYLSNKIKDFFYEDKLISAYYKDAKNKLEVKITSLKLSRQELKSSLYDLTFIDGNHIDLSDLHEDDRNVLTFLHEKIKMLDTEIKSLESKCDHYRYTSRGLDYDRLNALENTSG